MIYKDSVQPSIGWRLVKTQAVLQKNQSHNCSNNRKEAVCLEQPPDQFDQSS